MRWVDKYKSTNNITRKKRDYKSYKITNSHVKNVIKKNNNLLYAVPYQHYTNAIEGYFNVLKSRLQKRKGLTYEELVNNVKDVLDKIPIHIYKNLIKGAYDKRKICKTSINKEKKIKKYLY